jgi:hypothetical protein
MGYLQRQKARRSLVVVRDKGEAAEICGLLKGKSVTHLNTFDHLSTQELANNAPEKVLNWRGGDWLEQKLLDVVAKCTNFEVTISKYFDALRFGNFDSMVYYSFVDVPSFVGRCPGV